MQGHFWHSNDNQSCTRRHRFRRNSPIISHYESMILILTNSRDATADFLVPYLEEASVEHVRLDTDRLIQELAFSYVANTASFTFQGRKYYPSDFKAVWYRRPERLCSGASKDLGEESYSLNEWAETLEGFLAVIPNHRWMNHPSAIASASHKLEQLATAVRIGLNIPSTLVTQDPDELQKFYRNHDGKVITKPLSNGMVVDEFIKVSVPLLSGCPWVEQSSPSRHKPYPH